MTPLSPVSKGELLFFTLDDSGLVPPSPPPDHFMTLIKIFRIDVSHALAALNPKMAYGADVIPAY